MPPELPDASPGALNSLSTCQFCGSTYAASVEFCPRCGLQRGATIAGPGGGYPQPAGSSYPPASYPPATDPAAGYSAGPSSYAPAGYSAGPSSYAPAGYSAGPSSYPPAGYSAGPSSYAPAGYSAGPSSYPPAGFRAAGYPAPAPSSYPAPPSSFPADSAPPYAPYAGPYGDYADARPTPRRRHGIWIVAAVVAAILVIGGAVFAATQTGSSDAAQHVRVPDGPGVVYRSNAGHFAARFTERPDETKIPETIGNISLSIVVAADRPSQTLVECELISQALPDDQMTAALTAAIKSTAIGGNLTLLSDSSLTYLGHPAHEGDYETTGGQTVTALAVGYGNKRIYELIAPTGDAYDQLLASFVPVA